MAPEEIAGGLVIAGGDGAVLLKLVEEVLDQVACPVEVAIVFAPRLASGGGRNHHAFAGPRRRSIHAVLGLIGLIGNEGCRWRVPQQDIGTFQVVGLPRRKIEGRRIAQGIDGGVNLGAQPAPAASDHLEGSAPFFAPAHC